MAEADHDRLAFTRTRLVEDGWTRERLLVLVGVWLLVAPLVLPSFQVFLFTEFLLVALFAMAFNLLYGYTGLLSFGHALFYAAGAYALALVVREFGSTIGESLGGLAPLATLLVGVLVGTLFVLVLAVPVGFLSVRLDEIYFALITLSFSMAFYALLLQDPYGLTQGSDGMLVLLGSVDLFGSEFGLTDRVPYYYLALAASGASIYVLWRLVNSPFGTVCRAIRESPDRVAALGTNVTRHQWVAFVVSALFAGIAGLFIAPLYFIVTPEMAFWTTSAIPVVATVIGGAFYFLGPAVGAFLFLYLRWGISRFPALEAHWELFYGVVLIVVLLYFKGGAAAGLASSARWLDELADRYDSGGLDEASGFARRSAAKRTRGLRSAIVPRSGRRAPETEATDEPTTDPSDDGADEEPSRGGARQ